MTAFPRILSFLNRVFLAVLITCVSACASNSTTNDNEKDSPGISYLAKTDIDTVTDVHIQRSLEFLRTLAGKLYRRNPIYCKRTNRTIDQCVARMFDTNRRWQYDELQGKQGASAIELAFDDGYTRDRVLAFIIGLKAMVKAAYNNKTEFFVFDELEPQKLYNSARNIEIAVWRLSNRRNPQGELYLLSNAATTNPPNLSFERLFGKLIATQDMMARVIELRTGRRIKNIIQTLAGAIFLPI